MLGAAEPAAAVPCDETVAGVTDGARNQPADPGDRTPSPSNMAEGSKHGVTSEVQSGGIDQDEGLERARAVRERERGVGGALQRGEA